MQEQKIDDSIVAAKELAREIAKEPEVKYFRFGHTTLDDAVGLIAEGDFIALGGTAGSGKTSFCISLTKVLADQGVGVLWFSIELSPREFLKKFSDDPEKIHEFYVPRKISEPTLTWLERKIDEAIQKFGIKVVFIDHIGMIMNERDAMMRNGLEVFDERLKTIKSWAVNKGVAIVAISTVGQETSKKTKRQEPTMADFRGSSMIGHTSDLVLYMQRVTGTTSSITLNESLDWKNEFATDAKLWILKCRRTGMMKANIKMFMDDAGNFKEY